jgi:hypothetical protein
MINVGKAIHIVFGVLFHLPYKQRVRGSNPCASTTEAAEMRLFLWLVHSIFCTLNREILIT